MYVYVWVYSYKIQEEKMSKWLFTFLTRRDRKGSDVCRFSLPTSSLKTNSSSIMTFSAVCFAVLRTW